MGNIIQELNNKLAELDKEGVPMAINKDELLDFIATTQNSLVIIKDALVLISSTHSDKLLKFINKDKSSKSIKQYNNFKNRLIPAAKDKETTAPFSSLLRTITSYIDMLEVIEDKGDELFAGKLLSLSNTKVSHVVLLGVVADAEALFKFTTNLINGVVASAVQIIGVPPKYRIEVIDNAMFTVIGLVNDVYNNAPRFRNKGKGILDIILRDLKTKNVDINIVNKDLKNNLVMIKLGDITNATGKNFTSGVPMLRLFGGYFGKMWNNYKHSKYLKNKETKEWLETQIALLALTLDDSTDEIQKAKMAKIISNYQSQLAKLDRQIDNYINN